MDCEIALVVDASSAGVCEVLKESLALRVLKFPSSLCFDIPCSRPSRAVNSTLRSLPFSLAPLRRTRHVELPSRRSLVSVRLCPVEKKTGSEDLLT